MAYEIDLLNQICATLGSTTTHTYKINALNEWCTLLGGTGGHTQNIAALNEIDVLVGGSGGHLYDIRALNSIDIAQGGTGGFIYDQFALVSIGSNVNQIPAANLAAVWLDGTIVDVAGSKYFVDKKGGANVLITGYDFPAGWVKGFPYKSAATIDIFGQTGVPVVSLFQNFDYGNQYFTRHVAQVVDGNGVETSEAYVADIVAYSEALTGDDLTAANTYYGVPAEIVTAVRWVDPVNGLDTNPVGTKVAPWKTINKASASSTAGDTIYVKSGICVEDYNGTSIRYAYLSKTNTYRAVGLTKVRSIGTNRLIFMVSGNYNWHNFIFDGEGNTTDLMTWYSVGNKTVTVNNCRFEGATTNLIAGDTGVEVSTIFKGCIFIGASAQANQNCSTYGSIDSCYFINSILQLRNNSYCHRSLWKSNNKAACINMYDCVYSMIDNEFNYDLIAIGIATPFTTDKNWSVKYSKFYQNDKLAGAVYAISATGGAADIQYNDFISSLTTFTATSQGFILLLSMPSANIAHNNFTSITKLQYNHVFVQGTGVSGNSIKCNYNLSKSNSLSGTQLTFGSETVTAGLNNSAEFIGNRVIGFKQDYPLESVSTVHAVLLNCGINMVIRYNHISHTTLGLVVKTGTQQAYTSEGVIYNIIEECYRHLWIRGVSALNVFNNIFKHSAAVYGQPYQSAVYADENSAAAGDQFCENIVLKNNIYEILTTSLGANIVLDDHAAANGSSCEYECMYGGSFAITAGATRYTSVANAQASGWLLNSITSNPSTNAAGIPDFAITGINLDVAYDDGIDVGSDIPENVITNQQHDPWQMGAFVQ